MKVGVLTVRLRLFTTASLKDKRSFVKHLTAQLRRKFNVSVAEIDHQDDKRAVTLGVAYLANDEPFVHRVLSKIASHFETVPDCSVKDVCVEVW